MSAIVAAANFSHQMREIFGQNELSAYKLARSQEDYWAKAYDGKSSLHNSQGTTSLIQGLTRGVTKFASVATSHSAFEPLLNHYGFQADQVRGAFDVISDGVTPAIGGYASQINQGYLTRCDLDINRLRQSMEVNQNAKRTANQQNAEAFRNFGAIMRDSGQVYVFARA